jgi:Domain of unknown function (DUF4331)
MMSRTIKIGSWTGAFLASALLTSPGVSEGADHRDSPRLMANIAFEGNLDINDVYLFQSPTTKANTVIIATLSPAAGLIGPSTFRQFCSYEIRVQNTAALADNFIFQLSFSNPDAFGRQNFQLLKQSAKGQPLATQTSLAPASAIVNEALAFGPTGQPIAVKGGGRVMCGLFDDPFFFDLNAFNKFVMLAQQGAPLAERVAPFMSPNFPSNFFGNFNVLAIVLEVPTASLLSSKSDPKLAIWVRTVGINEQVDRMGRPAVATATIPTPFKNVFNALTPFTDQALFTNYMVGEITEFYGVTTAYAEGLAATLLPDLLTYDSSKPSGFLNGRLLTDDVIDAEFKLLTNGALTTDRVDNDSVFSNSFPYLGAAQPRKPLP